MGISSVAGFASAVGDAMVDGYRARVRAQMERRRLDALQLNLLFSGSLAAVGMVVDVIALQIKVHALQGALDEATASGDLHSAELLRGEIVAALQEPPASARLMSTLADYIPALVAQQRGGEARVIEGDVL